MNKIAVYTYSGKVWYDNLAEVVEEFTTGDNVYKNAYNGETENRLYPYLEGVVCYNVCYRDALRSKTADEFIDQLICEAPALQKEVNSVNKLRAFIDRWKPNDNYDIQCLSVKDPFMVLGHQFANFMDMRQSVEKCVRDDGRSYDRDDPVRLDDIHILCNYKPYPTFGGDSAGDSYDNFFFKKTPFSESEIKEVLEIEGRFNYLKAHEHLENVDNMPLLYRNNYSEAILLVMSRR